MHELRLDDPRTLVGQWSFSRLITDHRSGAVSRAHGTTTIRELSPTHLVWAERGTWHRAEAVAPVSRTLTVIHSEDRWRVTFDDGRRFHDWEVDADVVHGCSPDTYTGRVTPHRDDWRIRWRIVGPQKDCTITTDHARTATFPP